MRRSWKSNWVSLLAGGIRLNRRFCLENTSQVHPDAAALIAGMCLLVSWVKGPLRDV